MHVDMFIRILTFPLLVYTVGSLSFAVWITRIIKGVDVRDSGSHHASASNTFRQTGLGAGLLVLVLDIGKGFIPTRLAIRVDNPDWIIALTAVLVVVGHCWPVFTGFRGGMGLASASGCILAITPLGFAIGLAILIFLTLVLHHSARASVITGLVVAPVFYICRLPLQAVWVAAGLGLVIAFRFLRDWNRQYRELWLDRPPPQPKK